MNLSSSTALKNYYRFLTQKNTFSILLLLFFVNFPLFGQTVTVLDRETEKPVELVTLFANDRNIHAITNAKGQASISAFEGINDIEIRTLGYKTIFRDYSEIEAADFTIYLTRTDLNLDEVVVSATRWWQRSSDVPAKITSITQPQVALYNPQTSADLLATSGQVFIQKSQQGGGSPMIRGFATNRLLYTVDGIRMNTAIFRGGNIQNVINVDPFSIEKTEVVFGPGSVIYGSDAIGGVMSFQTLNPQFSLDNSLLITGKAVGRFSSANSERTGHFDVNVGWNKFAMITSFSNWNFGELTQGSHGPDEYIKPYYVQRQDSVDRVVSQRDELDQIPTAYSQVNLMQKFRYKPTEDLEILYGFHFSETSDYGRYDRHNRVRNGTARYAEWKYGPQRWVMNNLTLSHDASTFLYDHMTTRLAFQNFRESRIDRAFNDEIRSIREEEVDAYSVNLDFSKSTGSRNMIYFGTEYVLNEVSSAGRSVNIESGAVNPGPSRYPQANWQSIALYLNNEFKISDQLTAQAGLRYNHFLLDAAFDTTFYPLPFTEGAVNDGALTGSIGAVYRPQTDLFINASMGTAFRSPNVDDIGKVFDSEPGSVVVPNPDLDAEYAYNFELGVAKVFNNFMKAELTGYYTILNNAMVRRDYQLNGASTIMYDGVSSNVQAIQNAATARVFGFQASMNITFNPNFSFATDFNYQNGKEELDDGSTSPSRHAAPVFGGAELSYKASNLELVLYTDYQGERSYEELSVEERGKDEIYAKDDNGNNYVPAWATLNLKTVYSVSEQFALSAGLENILDKRYRPYSSGISGPGRNFYISLRTNI